MTDPVPPTGSPARRGRRLWFSAGALVGLLLLLALALPATLKAMLPGWVKERTGHALRIEALRFNPLTLAAEIDGLALAQPDGTPLLSFTALRVDLSAASLARRAWVFDEIVLSAPQAQVTLLADGGLNWDALRAAFAAPADTPPEPASMPRFDIDRLVITGGRVGVADQTRKPAFETTLEPIGVELANVSSLPDETGRYHLAARTAFGAVVDWHGEVGLAPLRVSGRLEVQGVDLAPLAPYLQAALPGVLPAGTAKLGTDYRVSWVDGRLEVQLDKASAGIEQLTLKSASDAEPALALARVAVQDLRFDLGRRSLSLGALEVVDGHLWATRHANGRLDLVDWLPPAGDAAAVPAESAAASAPAEKPVATAAPWAVELARVALTDLAVRVEDHAGGARRRFEIGKLGLALAANATLGGAESGVLVRDGQLEVGALRLDLGLGQPLQLARLALAGGTLDLAAKQAGVERVELSGGQFAVTRGGDGRIDLLAAADALTASFATGTAAAPAKAAARPVEATPAPRGKRARAAKAASPPAVAPAGEGWHYRIGEVRLAEFSASLRDESVKPAATLNLTQLGLRATGLSEDWRQPLPVEAALRIAGAPFKAAGQVTPAGPAADLKLELSGLPLSLAQPYLDPWVRLTIADGRLSAQGRATLDGKGPRFRGGFALGGLKLVETGGRDPVLAWKSLDTRSLSVSDKALDINELTLTGLDTRLHIAADKTVNVAQLIKRPPAPEGAATAAPPTAPAAAPAAPTATATKAPGFAVNVERLHVKAGSLDFSDLSLALPFGTRIHALAGAINGLSSAPGAPGQVELDGQVDEYGLARAVGQVDFFKPTEFMDLKVVFRNVEMNRLTPYTATFAGRKIDAGKLSLDLEYKVDKRQLRGENQIVMDNLTLGERVESPTARNLPLDLAIALLQDSDGKIDLGLPVAGSLDDPQFSYGALVWKAIANVITKLVTAPFRALGALFGGGEKFEQIAFESGAPALTPPEREKVTRLAQALLKRPALALTVHGVHAPSDRVALQDRQLRLELARRMGLPVAAEEDPGPLSTRQPKVREALEAVFADRLGAGELAALKAGFRLANPGELPESVAGKMMSRLSGMFREQRTLGEVEVAELKGADFYSVLYQRLRQGEKVPDTRLTALATARAEAVVAALAAAGAPAERIATAAPEAVTPEGRDVPVKLVLGTARRP